MAKSKEQKQKMIKDLEERFSKMKSLVFSDYYGLTVKEIQELRKLLREKSGDYLVTKKTLLDLALKDTDIKDVNSKELTGGLGLAFGFDDEIAPAKILADFSKKHGALKISAGILEKRFISQEKVLELAKLPGKNELMVQIVGSIKSPLSGLVGVLKGNIRNFIGVLRAIVEI